MIVYKLIALAAAYVFIGAVERYDVIAIIYSLARLPIRRKRGDLAASKPCACLDVVPLVFQYILLSVQQYAAEGLPQCQLQLPCPPLHLLAAKLLQLQLEHLRLNRQEDWRSSSSFAHVFACRR